MVAPVTAVVLTLNEESCIARCLAQLRPWAGEVLVFDSGSTDRTRELAVAGGARVVEQTWLGYAAQRNAALDAARHDWCLFVDADEIVDDELGAAVAAAVGRGPDPRTGFVVTRVEEFCGELMPQMRRRKKQDGFVRLMHRAHTRYDSEQLIHEEVVVNGPLVRLSGRMLHWRNFRLDQRFRQDNKNATLEAQMLDKLGVRSSRLRLAGKPILRFAWCYIYRGGWRAGTHGLLYSLNAACAEFMRQAKLWELQAVTPRQPSPRLYRSSKHATPAEAEIPALGSVPS